MEDGKQPHPVDVLVGGRVRAARIAAGLSQGALGDRIGLTFQQVQKYENGSNRISASKLVEIADTLGVSAAGFLEGLGAINGAKDQGCLSSIDGAHDLVAIYARLPPFLRAAVLQLARSLAQGPPNLSDGAPRARKDRQNSRPPHKSRPAEEAPPAPHRL